MFFDTSNDERIGWHEGSWLFPRVVRLLEIVEYRKQLLSGVVMSVSCRTDSTVSLSALREVHGDNLVKSVFRSNVRFPQVW